jgi:hypothetical protein
MVVKLNFFTKYKISRSWPSVALPAGRQVQRRMDVSSKFFQFFRSVPKLSTRFLTSFGMTTSWGEEERNTRFLASLEIEVVTYTPCYHPSLPFDKLRVNFEQALHQVEVSSLPFDKLRVNSGLTTLPSGEKKNTISSS